MAIPPDPIEEVLPHATVIVMAEVVGIDREEPGSSSGLPSNYTSRPDKAGAQSVRLKVTRSLKGEAQPGNEFAALKPLGAYALRVGNTGPFLLKQTAAGFEILGRYGPDTYSEKHIGAALVG